MSVPFRDALVVLAMRSRFVRSQWRSTYPGIVGFASGGRIRHPDVGFDGELYAIYLLADVQRSGIGRQLVRAWATAAIERGFHSAVVRVLAGNPAQAFYERLGGRKIKEAALTIGTRDYPELWYAWDDLSLLAR